MKSENECAPRTAMTGKSPRVTIPCCHTHSLTAFQNIAWALTRDVNFTRIIDDLWYRDITNIEQAYIDDFGQVSTSEHAFAL